MHCTRMSEYELDGVNRAGIKHLATHVLCCLQNTVKCRSSLKENDQTFTFDPIERKDIVSTSDAHCNKNDISDR